MEKEETALLGPIEVVSQQPIQKMGEEKWLDMLHWHLNGLMCIGFLS